jgi:uncharacterized oligopeptide transporter (OPT) family protein
MALGAFVAAGLRRWRPAFADRTVLPVASGFIAGESILGVIIALLVATGYLPR